MFCGNKRVGNRPNREIAYNVMKPLVIIDNIFADWARAYLQLSIYLYKWIRFPQILVCIHKSHQCSLRSCHNDYTCRLYHRKKMMLLMHILTKTLSVEIMIVTLLRFFLNSKAACQYNLTGRRCKDKGILSNMVCGWFNVVDTTILEDITGPHGDWHIFQNKKSRKFGSVSKRSYIIHLWYKY